MNGDDVVIRHLPFPGIAAAQNLPPGVAPVGAAKNAQYMIAAVRGERVDHIRIRWREGQTGAPELIGGGEPFCKVNPALSEIGAAPKSVMGAVRFNRCEKRVLILRMKQNAVAVIAAPSPNLAGSQSRPGLQVHQI